MDYKEVKTFLLRGKKRKTKRDDLSCILKTTAITTISREIRCIRSVQGKKIKQKKEKKRWRKTHYK